MYVQIYCISDHITFRELMFPTFTNTLASVNSTVPKFRVKRHEAGECTRIITRKMYYQKPNMFNVLGKASKIH